MDTRKLIADTALRIFADACDKACRDRAEAGEFPAALWRLVEENGLNLLGTPESDTSLGDACAVLSVAGGRAVPLPLAETLIANRLWTETGRAAFAGVTTIALAGADAPWARASGRVLFVAANGSTDARLAAAPLETLEVRTGVNLAGEARDRVVEPSRMDWVDSPRSYGDVVALLALTRVVMMAGCLETVLGMSIGYAMQRKQFGRPIAQFQAIQHQLAVLAGEAAAARRAADAATERVDDARFVMEVAAAKARVGEAAGRGAEIAHQVHGAMGFTHEHELHQFTRRLWAWRDEYGSEAFWQAHLGRAVAAGGADAAWAFIASH